MSNADMQTLCNYARQFTGLTDEKVQILHQLYGDIQPHLNGVTDAFYARLSEIPKASAFLDGRTAQLKPIHVAWLNELFTSNFDAEYTQRIYKVGYVHVKVKLPVEFMSGAMSLILGELTPLILANYNGQTEMQAKALDALNAAIAFSSLVMQESYQSSSLAEELERFLIITGMSRLLFDNLAKAYRKKAA